MGAQIHRVVRGSSLLGSLPRIAVPTPVGLTRPTSLRQHLIASTSSCPLCQTTLTPRPFTLTLVHQSSPLVHPP